jgi:hypothetical protein
MDFSMNVADSIYLIYPLGNPNLKSGNYRLDSIVSKLHLIGLRKHFYLSRSNASIEPNTNKKYYIEWIESIGTVHFPINFMEESGVTVDYPLHQICKKQQYGPFLTCKSSNGLKYFQDSCSYKYFLTNQNQDHFLLSSCYYFKRVVHGNGLAEFNHLSSSRIYPNPVSEYLRIDLGMEQPVHLMICNASGKIVRDFTTFQDKVEIQVSDLTAGLHNLIIQVSGGVRSLKFVKE